MIDHAFFRKNNQFWAATEFLRNAPVRAEQGQSKGFSKPELHLGQCGKDSRDKELRSDSEKQNRGCSEGDGQSGKSVFWRE